MGCSLSIQADKTKRQSISRRNTIILEENAAIQEGLSVDVTDGEQRREQLRIPTIIFIFGGPGSRKGRIISDLVDMFNFKLISGENLLLDNVGMKADADDVFLNAVKKAKRRDLLPTLPLQLTDLYNINSKIGTLPQLEHELRELNEMGEALSAVVNDDQLNSHWLLGLVAEEIKTKYNNNDTVVVDLIPSLACFVKFQGFFKNAKSEMQRFEREYPVTVAINLDLSGEDMLANINSQASKCSQPGQTQGNKVEDDLKDEGDDERTMGRIQMFVAAASEYLDYFDEAGRLTSVDVSTGHLNEIWPTIKHYVTNTIEAVPERGVGQVLLLGINEGDFTNIDKNRYPYNCIRLEEKLKDHTTVPAASVIEMILMSLKEQAAGSCRTFLVNIAGTKLLELEQVREAAAKTPTFCESSIGQLDLFVFGKRRYSERKKSIIRKEEQDYTVLTTLSNDILMFPSGTDYGLCYAICKLFDDLKNAEAI